jgi:protein-S-isoprenylcysteine O-methyltransferase Ste14
MAERDPAEARLWLMTLARLCGIGVVLLGLLVSGRAAGESWAIVVGLLLMGAGGALSLLGPKWLAQRWKK